MIEGIKAALGSVRAEVKSWASTEYATAVGLAALGAFVEETATSFITRLSGLTDWKASLLKNLGRVGFSALYFGLMRGRPLYAITMAAGPLIILGVDIINWLVGSTPQALGERLALKALGGWASPKAPRAMPVSAVPVASAVTATSSPATHPAFT